MAVKTKGIQTGGETPMRTGRIEPTPVQTNPVVRAPLTLRSQRTGYDDGGAPQEAAEGWFPGGLDYGQENGSALAYARTLLGQGGQAGQVAIAALDAYLARAPGEAQRLLGALQDVFADSSAPPQLIAQWVTTALGEADPPAALRRLSREPQPKTAPPAVEPKGTPPTNTQAQDLRRELESQLDFVHAMLRQSGPSGLRASRVLDEYLARSPERFVEFLSVLLDVLTSDAPIEAVNHFVSAATRAQDPVAFLRQAKSTLAARPAPPDSLPEFPPAPSPWVTGAPDPGFVPVGSPSGFPQGRGQLLPASPQASVEVLTDVVPRQKAAPKPAGPSQSQLLWEGTRQAAGIIGRAVFGLGSAVIEEIVAARARAADEPPAVSQGQVDAALTTLSRAGKEGARAAKAVRAFLADPAARSRSMVERRLVRMLETVDDNRRGAPSPAEFLADFISAAMQSASPGQYLKDLDEVLRAGALSPAALSNLGAKALRGHLDAAWLADTGLSFEWLEFMAQDPSTPWKALIEGTAGEQVRDDKWIGTTIKGIAAEGVAQEAVQADRRYRTVVSRQAKLINTEADFVIGKGQGMEVKSWDPDSWRTKLDAYEKLAADQYLTSGQRTNASQMEHLLRQLGDMHAQSRQPAVLAYPDDLRPDDRRRLEALVTRHSPGAQFVRLSRARIEAFEQEIWDGLLSRR